MRMLCTRCWRTARPDVWVPGSDRLELAAWLAGGVPGLVYCAWRQAGRRRACPACGGLDLVREARASARRVGEALDWDGGRLRSARPLRWPRGLRAPRARLRRGGAALGTWAVAAFALALPAAPGAEPLAAAAGPLGLLACLWLAPRGRRGPGRRCAAFDASGRPLPIEALP